MASESTRLEALRCADHDRELVAQVLNNAYAEGRITFEEHADRIARAYDARTFGDLNALIKFLDTNPDEPIEAVQIVYERPAFSIVGRASQGVTIFRSAEGEKVVSVERLADTGGDESDGLEEGGEG